MKQKILISTDCTCDLPENLLDKFGIEQLFFFIHTGTGIFRDRDEISAMNVFECMRNGQKVRSMSPRIEDYLGYFRKLLGRADNIIHITISSKISGSYEHALEARKLLGSDGARIHIVDSLLLSTGSGHLVLKAAAMQQDGFAAPEIVAELEKLRGRISTTFITKSAEYLYINGKVGAGTTKFLKIFKFHPVLYMKDGMITVKYMLRGDYDRAQVKYVKRELKNAKNIDKSLLFITHAGATSGQIERVKNTVKQLENFESVYVTNASATVSSNCGPETVGVLFIEG